jgi:hypothetical protein
MEAGSPIASVGSRRLYETLLFLHVLSAFLLAAGVVMYAAFVLGSPVTARLKIVAEILWGVGGVGTLVLGVWLALNRPEYELWDGWIIAALVLWVLATGSGAQASRGVQPGDGEAAVTVDRRTQFAHWMRTVYVIALLVVMVWKPGA